jgi:hypothetical protein
MTINFHSSTWRRRMNVWGVAAQKHWQEHRPASYAALKDPDGFFRQLGEEAAARYIVIRDGLLEGLDPNDGTIGWSEFQDEATRADQTARETVEREMIYLPPGEMDHAESPADQ